MHQRVKANVETLLNSKRLIVQGESNALTERIHRGHKK